LHLALGGHKKIIHAQESLLECHFKVHLLIIGGVAESLLEISRNELGHFDTAMAVIDTEQTCLITSWQHRGRARGK